MVKAILNRKVSHFPVTEATGKLAQKTYINHCKVRNVVDNFWNILRNVLELPKYILHDGELFRASSRAHCMLRSI